MAKLSLPVGTRDHAQGPASAAVTLVEYGDYECPHCGAAYPVVKKIQKKLGLKLRFVFRNFPLNTMHPHAEHAAETAEAAAAQNTFWEMHDWIFEHQDTLEDPDLFGAVKTLGLDTAKFLADMKSPAFLARVKEDFQSGVRSGVNGTPTFFINGVRHDGAPSYEDLLAALQAAIPNV
ncbi:MAG TPA: thioredoxin domain-containing protein [Planctomycetota bacterium]|jgi:protein-disulfide isomerase|nr:thioredoxin domain-containing protein [Planctomycetota bacterium]